MATMSVVRVAICQIDLVVGDLDANVERALAAYDEAVAADADVAVFPEMTITGYPPEDLVLKPGFVADNRAALEKFAARTGGCAAVVGFADGDGDAVWNAAAVCAHGRHVGTYHKHHLPNYAVFDEVRTFRAGQEPLGLHRIGGVPFGVTICEDAWIPEGPVRRLAQGGARLVLNINGSPFRVGKDAVRRRVVADRVAESGVPLVYVNLAGAQDELVFDGGSFVMDAHGEVIAAAGRFVEQVLVVDVDTPEFEPVEAYPVLDVSGPTRRHRVELRPPPPAPLSPVEERRRAIVVGIRDYVRKSGFGDVVVGLSGGIDSSLTAALAVEALGPSHVHGVLMPSRYSSRHSVTDAATLAANLGIETRTIPIEPAHAALTEMLAESFAGRNPDITDQNIQSRLRGTILMALANEFSWLVLTTGNKSETAVGYTTLYGDTAGAFAPLRDVWKTEVYELARHLNDEAGREIVPDSVLTKAPSAELRPDQRDDQSLPPYDVLDPILVEYVENDRTVAEILTLELADPDTVRRVCRLVDRAEYKRRQSPLGPRLSAKAFGRDRRIPIINHYRG